MRGQSQEFWFEHSEWPPSHREFVRGMQSSSGGYGVEVLPSCFLGEKYNDCWKALRDRPEWRALYEEIRSAVRRKAKEKRAFLLANVTILIIWIAVVAIVILTIGARVNFIVLLGTLLLAICLNYINSGSGTLKADDLIRLSNLIETSLVSAPELYSHFVKTGVFRIRAVRYANLVE